MTTKKALSDSKILKNQLERFEVTQSHSELVSDFTRASLISLKQDLSNLIDSLTGLSSTGHDVLSPKVSKSK